MAELNEEIKTFIVQQLACYMQPSAVAEAVKEEFEVEVDRRHVQFYHPEKGGAGKKLPKKWINLFNETRRQFDTQVAAIPVAKLSYRLSALQRMAEMAESGKDYRLAADLLKQAAQDRGGMFTNKREVKVTNPLQTLSDLLGVSTDELPDELQGEESVH
jgi:hypothetical protein